MANGSSSAPTCTAPRTFTRSRSRKANPNRLVRPVDAGYPVSDSGGSGSVLHFFRGCGRKKVRTDPDGPLSLVHYLRVATCVRDVPLPLAISRVPLAVVSGDNDDAASYFGQGELFSRRWLFAFGELRFWVLRSEE